MGLAFANSKRPKTVTHELQEENSRFSGRCLEINPNISLCVASISIEARVNAYFTSEDVLSAIA